jgi:predicted 3-demethylubiquinone-9 3-methyltransferase (glyoxalase superfamily)
MVKGATFRIAGQTIRCIDSADVHAFGFTPAVSFIFDCQDEATFNALFDRLSDQGNVFMAPDRYPFAQMFCMAQRPLPRLLAAQYGR